MQYRTYYVSSENGNDCHDGLSEAAPFATLQRLQKCRLEPGDKILLECGSVFEDQYLHLSASGSKELSIEIGAYGDGALPKIHANGTGIWYQDYGTVLDSPAHVYRGNVSSAILLYDAEYIWIHDLEITNQEPFTTMEAYCAPDKMDRTGVAVVAQNGGTLHVEVHAYVKNGKYCVVNNTYEPQDTIVYKGDGSSFELHMDANEIKWYQI